MKMNEGEGIHICCSIVDSGGYSCDLIEESEVVVTHEETEEYTISFPWKGIDRIGKKMDVNVIFFDWGECSVFQRWLGTELLNPRHDIVLINCLLGCDMGYTWLEEFHNSLGNHLHWLACLEWEWYSTSSHMTFKKTLLETIIKLYCKRNSSDCQYDSLQISDIIFSMQKKMISHLIFNFRPYNEGNYELDNFLFYLFLNRPPRGCTFWRINYSGRIYLSTSENLKERATTYDVSRLHKVIDHNDGDIYSLCFIEEQCSDVVEIVHSLASQNVCFKRIAILHCYGILSLTFLSSLPEGLECLYIYETKLNGDLEFPEHIKRTLQTLHLHCSEETIPGSETLSLHENRLFGGNSKRRPKPFHDFDQLMNLDVQITSNAQKMLRTLISHLPSVNAVCEGFLDHSYLPEIWSHMSDDNRLRLLAVFRSVGLCIGITKNEDLFPCKLPIGWPDRDMWPPFPESGESQTILLFEFSFVPASLFPDLIVAINQRKCSFPSNVKPLYYRFNAVYITRLQGQCGSHIGETDLDCSFPSNEAVESLYHRVHLEMMPHINALKVTIRGPRPCCQVTSTRSMITTVTSQRYSGITYKEHIICPICEVKRLPKPSIFGFEETDVEFCSKGHKVGSTDELLAGKLDISGFVTSSVGQVGRVLGETLDDHFCPKLFVVLPINLDSLSLKDRFVYSYIRDGYAVHLLCECLDQWHFVSSPGFRVGKPKEFFKKYGGRVCKLLRVISALGTPFKIAASVDPNCKAGAAVAGAADNISKDMTTLLDDYLEKYPHLKASLGSAGDDLNDLKSSDGLERSELSKFLEVACKGSYFGPLICTYVDKCNEWLWLCEEHYQQYKIKQRH